MNPLSNERVLEKQNAGYMFPQHLLQIAYSSNVFNYGVNNVFTNGPVPVFWAGNVYVEKGISIAYQQNIYHTKRVFLLIGGQMLLTGKAISVKIISPPCRCIRCFDLPFYEQNLLIFISIIRLRNFLYFKNYY